MTKNNNTVYQKFKFLMLTMVLFLVGVVSVFTQTAFAETNEYMFDFGNNGVQSGYIGVSAQDAYNSYIGYGFNNTANMANVSAAGQGELSDAVQFKSTSTDNTFNVDLDNGLYEVTVYLGNTNRTSIWAEGCLQIINMTGNNAVHTFQIPITDGQLNIMATEGKAGYAFTMSALKIKKLSNDSTMKPTIWICGDSTVCNYYPLDSSEQAGWGQVLNMYIDNNEWQIRNMAASGQYAKGFIDAGQFEPILKYGKKDDIYFISIGINDTNYSNANEYYEKVREMAEKAKDKGMKVILVKQQGRSTDMSRNPLLTGRWFGSELDRIGNELNLQVIDLFNLAQNYFLSIGQEATTALYMDGDTLHPNRKGAEVLARLIAEQTDFNNLISQQKTEYYYAINAEYDEGVYETKNSGYTGEAYVNLENKIGSSIKWNVDVSVSGNYLVTFNIANGSANDRAMKIEVNNGSDYWIQSFTTTGSWTTWNERGIVLPLNAGTNTIKAISNTDEGGPNIDYIRLEKTDEPIAEVYKENNDEPEKNGIYTIYIAGDSTAQSYRASYAPQQGWGYYLSDFIDSNIVVDNRAIAGRSSKSFYDNGRLDLILNTIQEGDYLLVQFGINDSSVNNEERYAPVCGEVQNAQEGSFEYYIKKYVEGAKEHGAVPVLISPTLGLKAYSNGKFVNSYTNYANAMKNISNYYNIPYIDLNSLMVENYNKIGYENAKLYHLYGVVPGSTDMTHFSEEGAKNAASLVGNEFNKIAGNSEMEDTTKIGEQIKEGKYKIKNLKSGLYLDVTDGKAKNGTNVQQWASDCAADYNTWDIKSQGNGYYKIYSEVGDKSYMLDLDYGKTENGTNIQIYQDTNSDAQQFKFVKSSDNSYVIYTKSSKDTSCLDVYGGSYSNGANVCQWTYNGGKNQMWILEEAQDSSDSNTNSNSGSQDTINNTVLVDYKYNNWGSAFQTDFIITNKGETRCKSWRLKLKASDFDISGYWNVEIEKNGEDIIITPASWQAELSTDASASFGIVSNGASKDIISYTVELLDENGKVIAASSK